MISPREVISPVISPQGKFRTVSSVKLIGTAGWVAFLARCGRLSSPPRTHHRRTACTATPRRLPRCAFHLAGRALPQPRKCLARLACGPTSLIAPSDGNPEQKVSEVHPRWRRPCILPRCDETLSRMRWRVLPRCSPAGSVCMCTADTAFACSLAAPPLLSQTFGRAAAVGWTRARQRRPRSRCSAAHVSLSPLRRDCCSGPSPLRLRLPPFAVAPSSSLPRPRHPRGFSYSRVASDLRPLSLRDAPLSTPPAHPVRRARLCALLGLSGGTPSAYDSVSLAVALSPRGPRGSLPPCRVANELRPLSLCATLSTPRSRAAVFVRCLGFWGDRPEIDPRSMTQFGRIPPQSYW